MKRLAATLATLAALTLIPAPAHADDEPYNCELYAADLQDRLSTSVALNYGLNVKIDNLHARVDRVTVQRDRKQARIVRLLARIERLRSAVR